MAETLDRKDVPMVPVLPGGMGPGLQACIGGRRSPLVSSDAVVARLASFHNEMMETLALKLRASPCTLNDALMQYRLQGYELSKKLISKLRRLDAV